MGEILGVQNSGLGMKACAQNEREINLGSFVSTWNERSEIRFGSSWNEPRSWVRVFMLGLKEKDEPKAKGVSPDEA